MMNNTCYTLNVNVATHLSDTNIRINFFCVPTALQFNKCVISQVVFEMSYSVELCYRVLVSIDSASLICWLSMMSNCTDPVRKLCVDDIILLKFVSTICCEFL